MSAAFYWIKTWFSRYQAQCSLSATTLHVLWDLFISKVLKNQNVSKIQNILTSGVKLSSCLTSHTTAHFRIAVANVGKHTQMLTPCHFRITSCLDIHAQKTELFHAFENSLFPSNSNMRGNHYFFPHIKARCIYGFTDISQRPWPQGFAFLDFSTVVTHAWTLASQKALGKGRRKDLLPLLPDKTHGKSEKVLTRVTYTVLRTGS